MEDQSTYVYVLLMRDETKLTSWASLAHTHQGPVMASCCCGHLLASFCSLAFLSLFFRALCSLISRSFLSICLPNCSRSSLMLSTRSSKGEACSTRFSKAGNRVSVRPRFMFVPELLELKESKNEKETIKRHRNCC